jgi:phosphate transport system permease protein
MHARRRSRHRRDVAFRLSGLAALLLGLGFVGLLFASVLANGLSAFVQTHVRLDVEVSRNEFDSRAAIARSMRSLFPEVTERTERRDLGRLLSIDAAARLDAALADEAVLPAGRSLSVWVPASSSVDMLIKGRIDRALPADRRPLTDRQIEWIDQLQDDGRIARKFNTAFFVNGDSREPELAGILGAMTGSALMLVITLLVAFPIGLAAAIYLDEFAKKSRWTDLVEVNINNLAAVPSIVFGLLGLAIFIDLAALPRSAPLVGGLVLALLTLPIIIITARSALQSVPFAIREGATALGASRMQVLFHHVLPLAMPGILTGTIIGMSRALGETAPLLMIGMVAFIVDVPTGFTDPATALPVQVYLWADSPEIAFAERTSAAIIVMLAFLLAMNLAAVVLRKRLEVRY